MSTDLEKRLIDLELKFMEQEQTLQDLSELVSNQWDHIEKLQTKLTAAHTRIISLEESLPSEGGDVEKPPHY